MTGPRLYCAFGLILASDFELDVLQDVTGTDQQIDLLAVRAKGIIRADPPPSDPFFDITPEAQYLHWNLVGAFRVTRPDLVEIEPHAGVSDFQVSQAFLGLVISLVLEQKGILSLHASAVNVGGRAAIFLGDKGAGKSTTNGALLARGHVALTDDLVAVDKDPAGTIPLVRPGFSSIKLWPDSVVALQLEAHQDDRVIHPLATKLQKRMPVPVAPDPVPMGTVFVLARSPDVTAPSAERLPTHQALQMVMRYAFMARYGETRLGQPHLVAHLRRCGNIVARVPTYELQIPDDLSRLGDLAEIVEQAITNVH